MDNQRKPSEFKNTERNVYNIVLIFNLKLLFTLKLWYTVLIQLFTHLKFEDYNTNEYFCV